MDVMQIKTKIKQTEQYLIFILTPFKIIAVTQ